MELRALTRRGALGGGARGRTAEGAFARVVGDGWLALGVARIHERRERLQIELVRSGAFRRDGDRPVGCVDRRRSDARASSIGPV